ncbi:hypothetical protein BDY21DRAFT_185086 [Lineolata rhizophorae]|uniref:Uncharacterized protein n=1 Tax=Lineolata rhizophorae TaxID=578093 RepID=A0A6A6P8H6_9PEZI|nr:hypothetical protein BDY21DRAFT_185086 [Lineolata rhizophorae]
MSTGYFHNRTKTYLDDLWTGLVTASHILHHHSLLPDASNISVRNPDNPDSFFIPRSASPVQLSASSAASALLELNISDANPVPRTSSSFPDDAERPDPPPEDCLPAERHIHASLYARFPALTSILHICACPPTLTPFLISASPTSTSSSSSSSTPHIPFTTTSPADPTPLLPLRPLTLHASSALAAPAPLFDPSALASAHDPFLRSKAAADALAARFARAETSAGFLAGKLRGAWAGGFGASGAGAQDGGAKEAEAPARSVVLLAKGHGGVVVSCADGGLEEVCWRGVGVVEEAGRVREGVAVVGAVGERGMGGKKWDGEGKLKEGRVMGVGVEGLGWLGEKECAEGLSMEGERVRMWWEEWRQRASREGIYGG